MSNRYQSIMQRLEARNLPGIGASEAQLDVLELQLGYSLPADYREFLRDYGDCRLSAQFPVLEEGRTRYEGMSIFYGALNEELFHDYKSLLQNYDIDPDNVSFYSGLSLVRPMEGVEEIGWPEELLPIGDAGGGSQICLALFGLRPGAIFFWRSSPFDNAQNLYLAANSFDEFMNLLEL